MRVATISAVFLLVVPSAGAQEVVPCPAMPATPAPCASDTIATVDAKPVRLADLDAETRKAVEHLDTEVAEARRKAVRDAIDDILLDFEAKRRGTTPGDLLNREVRQKVAEPSAADVQREIDAHPEKYKRDGQVFTEFASSIVYRNRLAGRQKAFLHVLEGRYPVAMGVDPSATIRPDAVLATVGKRTLTMRDAAARIELAVALARIDAAEQEKDAVDKLAHNGQKVTLKFDVPRRPLQDVEVPGAPFRGERNAPVTIVEFGDFQCPPCGRMSKVVDEVLPAYGPRVRYVFREFPLEFHQFAWRAAEAAMAAHAQGKFFPYAQLLFANQKALDVESLRKYARLAGLDVGKFDRDLKSGRFAGEIERDKRDGERVGVIGTPAFFINGAWLDPTSFNVAGLKKAIDQAMGATEKAAP
jgi:protein-disulfide isomerase